MFKLLKILGARCNAPEIVEVEVELDAECFPGRFYTIEGGKLKNNDGSTNCAIFVPIQYYGELFSTEKIKGYFVTSDMVFEGDLLGGLETVRAGSKLSANINESEVVDGVLSVAGDFAYAVDIKEYEKSGKISFRLAV